MKRANRVINKQRRMIIDGEFHVALKKQIIIT